MEEPSIIFFFSFYTFSDINKKKHGFNIFVEKEKEKEKEKDSFQMKSSQHSFNHISLDL